MNHYIFTDTKYEIKITSRSWLIRLLCIITILAIAYVQVKSQLSPQEMIHLSGINYLPSEIPYFYTKWFNVLQSFFIIFATLETYRREKRADTLDVFRIRPISNTEHDLSKFFGIVVVLLVVNCVTMAITIFGHLFMSLAPFRLSHYLFYFLTWSFPALIFISGLALCIVRLIRHSGLSLIILLGFMYFSINHVSSVQFGAFDFLAHQLSAQFSDVYGYPEVRLYLCQRFAYFLLGIGFLSLSIFLNTRIPNHHKTRTRTKWIAAIFMISGMVLCLNFRHHFIQDNKQREIYKDTYTCYTSTKWPKIQEHDIEFHWNNDTIRATSKIHLKNERQDTLVQIIFYLNPSLKIHSINSGQDTLPFKRDNQVVIIRHTLFPGEEFLVDIRFSGKIDNRICYTDIPSHSHTSQSRYFSFTEKDYLLLTPECLWYPITVPPSSPDNYHASEMNFSQYTLRINAPGKNIIVTQGFPCSGEGQITYKDTVALPGLSLVMGNYTQKSIRIKNVDLEIYHFDGHDYFSRYFTSLTAKDIEKIIESGLSLHNLSTTSYPYHKFMLVETPNYFYSWNRTWKHGSEYIQPELFFLAERGFPLNLDFHEYFKNKESDFSEESREKRVLSDLLHKIHNKGRDIYQMIYPQTIFISSEEIPIADKVVKILLEPYNASKYFTPIKPSTEKKMSSYNIIPSKV